MANDAPADAPPFVAWSEFFPRFCAGPNRWRQGEHVALVGPTGQGKTTLALALLPARSWTVILATKPKDATLNGLVRSGGYVRLDKWRPPPGRRRILLWPKMRSLDDTRAQATVLRDALGKIFSDGAWCVLADDVQYLELLGLRDTLRKVWINGRSVKVTMVAATQRPVWVPREMWSQSSHLFVWGTTDREDLKALSGFGARVDERVVRDAVRQLDSDRHEVLYIDTRRGTLLVTQAPPPPSRKAA